MSPRRRQRGAQRALNGQKVNSSPIYSALEEESLESPLISMHLPEVFGTVGSDRFTGFLLWLTFFHS